MPRLRLDRLDIGVFVAITVLLAAILITVVQWQARPRGPRIVYLGPTDVPNQNLYAVDPVSGKPERLTDSQDGILDYDVTPDGSKIVYSEVSYSEGQRAGTARLSLLDAASGKSSPIYECAEAACLGLAWRPDGGAFAFQRVDSNTGTSTGPGSARVWIFDLAANAAHPLFADNQQLGYSARWSPDGTKIAVFSVSEGGIVIHDFKTSKDAVIPAQMGDIGMFSPDGKWLYFPQIMELGDGMYGVHLTLIDVSSEPYTTHELIAHTEKVSDVQSVWRADSKALIVARQPPNHKINQGPQLFSIDVATGAATPILSDDTYNLDSFKIDGNLLVLQRTALGDAVVRPELWMLDLSSGQSRVITGNGTAPRWLP